VHLGREERLDHILIAHREPEEMAGGSIRCEHVEEIDGRFEQHHMAIQPRVATIGVLLGRSKDDAPTMRDLERAQRRLREEHVRIDCSDEVVLD